MPRFRSWVGRLGMGGWSLVIVRCAVVEVLLAVSISRFVTVGLCVCQESWLGLNDPRMELAVTHPPPPPRAKLRMFLPRSRSPLVLVNPGISFDTLGLDLCRAYSPGRIPS